MMMMMMRSQSSTAVFSFYSVMLALNASNINKSIQNYVRDIVG